jgi:hypothetical protein
MTTITWTREKRDKFRQLYNKAANRGEDSFVFERHVIVTGYAKYLLQYLDTKFEPDVSPHSYERPKSWRE